MIEELSESALEELKRADHSIYVSLKYTRTVDIIKNTIKRLLSAYDISIIQGLEWAKENKKLPTIPPSSRLRAQLIVKFYPQMKKSIDFYNKLKVIDKADYKKKEEYRKNVALIAKIGSRKVEVSMGVLREYFDFTVCFSRGITEITNQKKFLDAKKVKVVLPVKKPKKEVKKKEPEVYKHGKLVKKKTTKKVVKKSYKVNPAAPKRYGY